MDEDTNNYDASALAISAGLLALGAGAYVYRRRSRNHVGG
jgi:LPXTG-motif cell wall-anchored protein